MKKIGKIIFISIILSLVIGIGFVSAQQFQSIRISTITAQANVTGGQLAMFVEIRRRDNNNTASNISWTVPAGSGWTLADQYILLHSTLTQSGGIRIYTDNNAADANPRYGGSFGENNGAGLISTSSNTAFLPMAWLIQDNVSNPQTGDPQTSYSWFYFKDRSQTNFWSNADTRDYSTVARAGYGYHFAQGPDNYGAMPSPNPIYIEANFVNAVGGWTYRTTTLRIELFSQ